MKKNKLNITLIILILVTIVILAYLIQRQNTYVMEIKAHEDENYKLKVLNNDLKKDINEYINSIVTLNDDILLYKDIIEKESEVDKSTLEPNSFVVYYNTYNEFDGIYSNETFENFYLLPGSIKYNEYIDYEGPNYFRVYDVLEDRNGVRYALVYFVDPMGNGIFYKQYKYAYIPVDKIGEDMTENYLVERSEAIDIEGVMVGDEIDKAIAIFEMNYLYIDDKDQMPNIYFTPNEIVEPINLNEDFLLNEYKYISIDYYKMTNQIISISFNNKNIHVSGNLVIDKTADYIHQLFDEDFYLMDSERKQNYGTDEIYNEQSLIFNENDIVYEMGEHILVFYIELNEQANLVVSRVEYKLNINATDFTLN